MKTNTTKAALDIITMCDHLKNNHPDDRDIAAMVSKLLNLEVWIIYHGGGQGDRVWDAEMQLTCTGIVDAARFCEANDLHVSMMEFHSQYRPNL